MASRRKKRKQQDEVDPLGGFSMEELFGLDPVSEPEVKQSTVGKILKAPFKLVGLAVKTPIKLVLGVVKLPIKLVKAILPSRSKG